MEERVPPTLAGPPSPPPQSDGGGTAYPQAASRLMGQKSLQRRP